jgi:TolB-like protein/class 3 adenylate cyclase
MLGTIVPDGERRLAAIMYTDMVGYTALGQRNEALSLALVEEQRKLIRPILSRFNGREVKTMGDAFLVEFPNALDALRCAYDIQRATREFNVSLSPEKRIHLRIGLHLGDVVESLGDISGDAVNVASRIEPLAEDGGVCLTRQVYESTHNMFELRLASTGMKSLKNVKEPMEVFRMEMPWEKPPPAIPPAPPLSNIAILPFSNFSPDPNDAYFADGVTDEIISAVAGISGLNVISRTSAAGYKGTKKRIEEIGKELKVGSILEGTFKKAGNKIRVTTQLIDVARDRHLWAQNYDRNLDDVFEVQSDIAKQVADALRVKILSNEAERVEKRPTKSTEAYTWYLKGMYLRGKWSSERPVEAVKEAAQCFEQAVREDPGFALAYVGLADCSVKVTEFGVEIVANLEKAKRMSARALELDPELAEAHSTYGWASMYSYDIKRAEDEFKKAIQLKPSDANAHNGYYCTLHYRLKWEEAVEHIETAMGLNPLSPELCANHGRDYYMRGDYHRALDLFKRAVDLGGSNERADVAFMYGKMKMFEEMRREYAAWVELLIDTRPLAEKAARAQMAYLEDDKETLSGLLPELESHVGEENGIDALFPGYTVMVILAIYYFYLGEHDKGFECLERAYSRKEPLLLDITYWPAFDGVRTDPWYLDLVKRLGLD